MKTNLKAATTMLALMSVISSGSIFAQSNQVDTRIGTLEFTKDFENGYPTDETVTKLYDEMDFQRACQAYMWSIALVGFVWWQHHQDEVMSTKNGPLVYAPDYDTKFAGLTLNVTTPYVWGFVDMKKSGPFVIEIPPGN
mgnify:FL=1